MAKIQISQDDMAAIHQAQRNEAWDACARNGAALQSALRQIDALEKELAEANAIIADLKAGPGDGHQTA